MLLMRIILVRFEPDRFARQFSIPDRHNPVDMLGDTRVMADDNNGQTHLPIEIAE